MQQKQSHAATWFKELRNQICSEFEAIEREAHSEASFERKQWQRPEGGGGEMSIMHGQVFEKVGVNISTVHGMFSEQFRKEIPGGNDKPYFWASGISLVAHMTSPLVPAVHMNTRMIVVSNESLAMTHNEASKPSEPSASPHASDSMSRSGGAIKSWFGGGADLTPMIPNEQDRCDFHAAFQKTCDAHDPGYYEKFKAWCDEYFFLKHRHEPRGVGGIFYDYVDTGNWQKDVEFTQDVGKTFLDIYPQLVRRHMHESFTPEQREAQLIKRGRYVEFNLLYDRGTKFGLMTGGNTEAILMSLPPVVKWP